MRKLIFIFVFFTSIHSNAQITFQNLAVRKPLLVDSINFKFTGALQTFIVPNKVSYTDILKSNSISCLTAFLDIKKLGKKYMPLIRKRQDMGLWLNYLKVIPFAHGIQETQAIYRIRENSLSRKKLDLIKYQWQFYREVEKLNVLQSAYYMLHWMYRGFMKYRN